MSKSTDNNQREAGKLDIDLSDKTVLIVDDETFMLNLMNRVMKEFNAGQIERASNGQEAMTILSRMPGKIDLIVSDCNMAPINGLEFLKLIRGAATKGVPHDLPFIMVTGHGDEPVVKKALELDVSGYCVKPVAPEKLAKVINQALEGGTDVKDKQDYRDTKLVKPAATAFGEAKQKTAWVLWSDKGGAKKEDDWLKKKLEQIRAASASETDSSSIKLKNRRKNELVNLESGVYLAEDVESEEGRTLLTYGTQLSENLIERLQDVAREGDGRSFIWVGDLDEG